MRLRTRWTRLIALVLGWAMALTLAGVTPSLAAPGPLSSAGSGASTPATAPTDRGSTEGEAPKAEPDADGLSLLEGLDVQVAEVDPAAAEVKPGVAPQTAQGKGTQAQTEGAEAPVDLRSVLLRPAPQAAADKVDPAVADALAEAEDGKIAVVVEMTGSADLAELGARAESAGLEAAREVRQQARSYSADVAGRAAEAADRARGSVVVETLRATGAERRAALIEDLGGAAAPSGRSGAATDAAQPTDLWIVNSVGATVDADTLAELEARDDVAHVRLETQVELPETPSEPALPTWSLEKVHAPQTWGEYGHRGEGVSVAVLDTGVDFEHPALAGQYRGRDGDHSDSWFVTTGENYPVPGDGNGHGTHVTGSIAGGPPGEVVGVAPEAEWIGVKILTDGGRGGEIGILRGMQWVMAPGGDPAKAPDIASNSWGGGPGSSPVFWDAVNAWRAAGIVPLFANGNDGPASGTVGNPGGYPQSIGVGATDSEDTVAWFSSRGPSVWDGQEYIKPQVSAPGHQIRSAWPTDLSDGDPYNTISGTSMATPHVTGVAALVLSANPGLTVDEVQDLLQDTARTEPFMGEVPNNAYGYGIVDAYAATTRAAHSGLVSGRVTGPSGPVGATLTVVDGPSTTSDPATGDYELYAAPGTRTVEVTAYGYASQRHTVEVVRGGNVVLDVTLSPAGSASLTGTVTGDDGPLAGARVSVVGQSAVTAYTDASGSYALPVALGTHEVRVQATGYRDWTGEVTVEGDATQDVALEPLALTGTRTWPQLKGGPAGHGLADSGLDASTLQEQWTADVGAVMFSSPAADGDTVYQLSSGGTLTALDLATGEKRWSVPAGSAQRGTPALSADGGTVYVTTGNQGTLLALDTEDGATRWTYDLGGDVPTYGSPSVVDGTVYVAAGSGDTGSVHAVDAATGERVWSTAVGGGVFFGPAVADGVAVTTSVATGTVVALDTGTGETLWERTNTLAISQPAIDAGKVYLGTSTPDFTNGSVLALDLTTGETVWEVTGHGDTQGSSPVLYDDLVILGSHTNGTVTAYRAADGELVWTHFADGAVTSTVAVTTGGVVLGGTQSREIFALDASTGQELWSQETDAAILSSTAVSEDAAVFVVRDGTVAAYRSTGVVSGTVTGPDGPVEATVELVGTGRSTTSDAATGAYELRAPAGDYTLRVSRYGLSVVTREITISPTAELTVDLDLTPVGTGSLAGTVTDEDARPLEDATITVLGTPLPPVTTTADGAFTLPEVAAGQWTLRVEKTGYAVHEEDVTVVEGEQTTVEVALGGFDLAVVADYDSRLSRVLRNHGWSVDELTFTEAASAPERYDVMVLNGRSGDYARDNVDNIEAILTGADAAGTSVVALDSWGAVSGSVDQVLQVRGSAGHLESVYASTGRVWLTDPVAHPITAPIDQDRYPVLDEGLHAWLVGYEGANLATIGDDATGEHGSGIGYERTSTDSVQVLLPAFSSSALVGPEESWTSGAEAVFVAAVQHAVDAAFGTVALTVTGPDGAAVDTEVAVSGSFEHEDLPGGTGEILLPPGTHTLVVSAPGMRDTEQDVEVTLGGTSSVEVTLVASDLGAVAGTVTDDSGAPVAAAQVRAGDGEPVTTGVDGYYSIPDLEVGTWTVTATADGYVEAVVEDVEVSAGTVTTVDLELVSAPAVAVLGDYDDRITTFLDGRGIPATAVGWEVMDALDDYDVVVMNDPAAIPDLEWLDNLAALDAAGVSVIFTASNSHYSTSAIYELSDLTGDPAALEDFGGYSSGPKELTGVVEHPITAGLGEEPVIYLNARTDAPSFVDYGGTVLAQVGEAGDVAGPAIAYDVRGPDSVHVLLSGLFVGAGDEVDVEWAEPGRQLFLNAVRYAGSPRLAQVSGTVTDPEGTPVADAEVTVEGRTWSDTTDDGGQFLLGMPDGTYTVHVSHHGYVRASQEVTVTDGAAQDLSFVLGLGTVGTLTGTVTGSGLPGTGLPADAGAAGAGATAEGVPLEGAAVRLVGTPLETVTDAQGRFTLPRVEAGEQELEVELDGYIRTLHGFTMTTGDHDEAVPVLESARVGLVADSTSGVHEGRLGAFLEDWGYEPVTVDWTDPQVADLDMVLVNDPSYAEDHLPAFLDAVNRADLPVVWTGNRNRGAIEAMVDLYGDPEAWVEGSLDGAVTTTVVAEHPLTTGLPESFPTTDVGRMYGAFTGYSGTTVATITSEDGPDGDSIAYDGRTAGSVDVLLSTSGASSYGAVGTREAPEFYFSPQTSRSLTNALQWALTADGLGGDTRGSVVSSGGEPLEATVTVEETGRSYPAREGDGAYVIPLEPGTWTLTASTFGHDDASTTVTVAEGESVGSRIVLPVTAGGPIQGTVRSPEGVPVAGAEVSVEGTRYVVTTDAEGRFTFAHLPSGDWVVVARAEGMVTDFVDVTVAAGETTTADARLGATATMALVGDHSNDSMGELLAANGYTVERSDYDELGALDVTTGAYDLVFLNGWSSRPSAEVFTAFLDEAAAHDVSVVFASQYGNGSIQELRDYLGDPASVDNDYEPDEVGYEILADHPVFDGYRAGDVVTLLSQPGRNQQFQSFAGYSGTVLADTVHPPTGNVFDQGLGYRFASPGSVQLLLGNLAASSYASPVKAWTFDAERITLNGVAWAMVARQSDVHGTVTGPDGPVEGAEVTVAGTGGRDVTDADGAYQIGVAAGELNLEVRADGFRPYSATVTVEPQGSLLHDVALTPLPSSSLGVSVVDDYTLRPVPGARVEVAGPGSAEADTDGDGVAVLDPLPVGDYTVTVTGPGHVTATAEVTVGEEPTTLTVQVSAIEVAVLGDVRGDLTEFLVDEGVAAEEIAWSDVVDAVGDYGAVVVNGGDPDEAVFDALVQAADTAQVDLLLTGTYGVDQGGIRLLERYGDGDVVVGGQGYREGAVGLTDVADHPVLAGVTDPAHAVADDGYYSWLTAYPGEALATLTVGGEPAGTAVAWEERSALSGHLLLSFAAVSDYMGPDRGWSQTTEQVVVDSLEWLLRVPPERPTLTADQTLVGTSPVEVGGIAVGAGQVEVLRGEEVLATVVPADDWTWTAQVDLVEGPNTLVARATNEAGTAESEPLDVTLDTTAPALDWVAPADGTAVLEPEVTVRGNVSDEHAAPVTVTVQGEEVDVATDGSFEVVVTLEEGAQDLTVVATDAVGNWVSATRQVAWFDVGTAWDTAGGRGKVQSVKLALTDAAGDPLQVDGVELELIQEGEMESSFGMRFVDGTDYLALVQGVPPGTYDLRAVLTIQGFEAVVDGPELRVWR